MNKKYTSLLKDTLIFAVGSIGSKMILFILVPLYTHCLTPSEYGIADLVFTFSQFIIPIVSLVIYHAVLRFGLSKHENIDNVLLCGLIVALIGSLITIFITPLVGLYESISQWKWYFCFYIVLHMFLSILQNYVKAKGKNRLYATVSIIYTLVLALLNLLFLLWADMGIRGYLLASVLATAAAVLIFVIAGDVLTFYKRAVFDKDLFKRMLKFSIPLVADSMLWWLIQSSNKVVVEGFLGAEPLGFYTTATKIPALIYVIITVFSQAWGISTVKEIEDINDTAFYSKVFSVYSFITFGACISIIAIIKPFMSVYVGNEFYNAWQYVPLLLIGTAFLAISDFFGAFYNAMKKTVRNTFVTSFSAIISLVIVLTTVKHIGIWAAILATFIAYFIIMWVRLIDVKRYIKVKINWLTFILNQLILISQAILVLMNYNIYIVSAITAVVFVIINLNSIKRLFVRIKGFKNE